MSSRKFKLEAGVRRPSPTLENPSDIASPIFGGLNWAKPDDVSYRDYLRGVFTLYGHQQVLGKGGDLKQWTGILEKQLITRFFQSFTTTDRTNVPLNRLLIPIIRKILIAPSGTGFGFAVPTSTIPVQGALPDRVYLDSLLKMAKVKVPELENRYRLPLREADNAVSSPVLLNIYTLKRILSDTAQGPVEPEGNIISPPIPGNGKKPILWDSVVGSAPFFLRFEEWLDRQRPFFPENLFSLRTQIQGYLCGEPWLNKPTTDYLNYEAAQTAFGGGLYIQFFATLDELHRTAKFLLAFGAADAKLFEFLSSYDRSDFSKALRLLGEAEALLQKAKPEEKPGEDWMPFQTPSPGLPRSLSFLRRRRLPVTNIAQLSRETPNGPKGLELFFQLPRPGFIPNWDLATNLKQLVEARGLATRLVKYQRAFLVPMLRGLCMAARGDFAGAQGNFAMVSGHYVGYAQLATPAGAVYDSLFAFTRAVYHEGTLPYTFRVLYDGNALRDPDPFSLLGDTTGLSTPAELGPTDLHAVEEAFVRLVQGDSMLKWAEVLYRSDDPSSLERARELYKGVFFLHGEEPGTSAWARHLLSAGVGFEDAGNPLLRGQIERARLGLTQLEAGLNFYGYRDDLVPTLRYRTLRDAANRWATAAKAAQTDFLAYMTRLEQLDLDVLSARAQQRKARAQIQIATEQVEITKAGIAVVQRLVQDVEKRIEAKRKEIEDANSLVGQLEDYFKGMKDSISSIVDAGKTAKEGATGLGIVSDEEIAAATKELGSGALSGVGVGGLAVVGGIGAFAVLSVITLQGMADAATRRDGELASLRNEALPAAQALVHVQERQVAIAMLQESIANTELAYTTDLLTYHGERFLNRDFWLALSDVARRSMRRQLDLAAQAGWSSERALAYEIARPIRIVRLDYFDARLRDVSGVDRLMVDLSELEAVRLASARLTVPIRRTYSLARDLPLAYGALKRDGRCSFAISDDDLSLAHPGTYAHRLRAVTVAAEAPGAAVAPRGMLSNRGLSFVRRGAGAASLPLVRFEDGLPVSEFRLRNDMEVYEMPGEQLMPFEGSGFSTSWELDFPVAANADGLSRLTDVLITFDVRASYAGRASTPAVAAKVSRSLFASALQLDTAALSTLRGGGASGKVQFRLAEVAIPGAQLSPKITNAVLMLPGVDSGTLAATMRLLSSGTAASFSIVDGLAMSNRAHFSDGIAGGAHPLNALANKTPAQTIEVEIQRAGPAGALLQGLRDVVLWLEYEYVT